MCVILLQILLHLFSIMSYGNELVSFTNTVFWEFKITILLAVFRIFFNSKWQNTLNSDILNYDDQINTHWVIFWPLYMPPVTCRSIKKPQWPSGESPSTGAVYDWHCPTLYLPPPVTPGKRPCSGWNQREHFRGMRESDHSALHLAYFRMQSSP